MLNLITPRRNFLITALGVTAGVTLPIGIAEATGGYPPVEDPILSIIRAHKEASAGLIEALDRQSSLEEELPYEKRRTYFPGGLVETDDPRWIESAREVIGFHDAIREAADAMISVEPTTREGLLALLQYAVTSDTDGEQWHPELMHDDGRSRHWYYFLIANVIKALDPGDRPDGSPEII